MMEDRGLIPGAHLLRGSSDILAVISKALKHSRSMAFHFPSAFRAITFTSRIDVAAISKGIDQMIRDARMIKKRALLGIAGKRADCERTIDVGLGCPRRAPRFPGAPALLTYSTLSK